MCTFQLELFSLHFKFESARFRSKVRRVPNKGLILVHTVKLKPIIKAQISGKLVTSGISDVAIISVHSEKTRLKKLMNMIIIITNNRKTIY